MRRNISQAALRLAALALLFHGVTAPRLGAPFGPARAADVALLLGLGAFAVGARASIQRASLGWAACVAILGLGIPWADAPGRALTQLFVLLYVGALFALGRELGRRDVGSLALTAFVAGCVACSLAGIAGVVGEVVLGESFGWARRYAFIVTTPRAVGPTESPAMLGIVAACGLVGVWALHRSGALGRGRAIALGMTLGLALLLTQSRPILDLVAGASVAVAIGKGSRGTKALALACGAGTIIVLLLTLAFRFSPFSAVPPFIDTHPSLYALTQDMALRMFADHPLAGVGLEGFQGRWSEYFDAARYAAHLDGLPLDPAQFGPIDPHSTYAGFLAEAGLASVAAFALLFFGGARLWRRDRPELVCLLCIAVLAGTHMDVLTNRALALGVGLLAGYSGAPTSRRR